MSKHAVGIYSGRRPEGGWKNFNDAKLQALLDGEPIPLIEDNPMGKAEIVTYTVILNRGRPELAFIIGKMLKKGGVFMGVTDPEDSETPAKMLEMDPLGEKVFVTSSEKGTRFTLKR